MLVATDQTVLHLLFRVIYLSVAQVEEYRKAMVWDDARIVGSKVNRHIFPGQSGVTTLFTGVLASVKLKLVVFPLMSTDVQLFRVLAHFEGADIRTEVSKDVAPVGFVRNSKFYGILFLG